MSSQQWECKTWLTCYIWNLGEAGAWEMMSKIRMLNQRRMSAVTWLCFTPNSEQIITASKDGTMRIWNINVRYYLDEDPKTLKVFQIPLRDANGSALHYDHLSISCDGKILAATHGSMLQWLCTETGNVLDTADKAHDGDITSVTWAPESIPLGGEPAAILATASTDKKVKFWKAPHM